MLAGDPDNAPESAEYLLEYQQKNDDAGRTQLRYQREIQRMRGAPPIQRHPVGIVVRPSHLVVRHCPGEILRTHTQYRIIQEHVPAVTPELETIFARAVITTVNKNR